MEKKPIVFPNPSNEMLNIISDKSIIHISIYNLHGQLVYKKPSFNSQTKKVSIPVIAFPPAIYFIHIEDINQRHTPIKWTKH